MPPEPREELPRILAHLAQLALLEAPRRGGVRVPPRVNCPREHHQVVGEVLLRLHLVRLELLGLARAHLALHPRPCVAHPRVVGGGRVLRKGALRHGREDEAV